MLPLDPAGTVGVLGIEPIERNPQAHRVFGFNPMKGAQMLTLPFWKRHPMQRILETEPHAMRFNAADLAF
jgi:hypothetical protein